jgi:cephalosporin-C deacetylase
MPLDELRKYMGRNPRPDDFDQYWDSAIAEMKSVDAKVELVPYETKAKFAECFDMYFTGVGGARIHAKYLRPKNIGEPHPAVLAFHGYSGNCGDWFPLMSWIAAGYSVAALDCRGQGGLSEDVSQVHGTTLNGHMIRGLDDAPEKLVFRSVYLDTAQLASIMMDMPEVDAGRVGTMGGSQGGSLSLVCAALEPRIKLAAPVFPGLSDYLRIWEMDAATGPYAELCAYFRQYDPRHKREFEVFTKLGYIDVQHFAKRIKAEVLMMTGLMDTICLPSTQFAIYNKIESKKNMLIYPDYGHEGIPECIDEIFEFMCGL